MTNATTQPQAALPQDVPLLDTIEPKVVDALAEQADDLAHGKTPNEYVKTAMALGSVPIMLGALATMAPAQTASQPVVDVLNYALLLENLESEFYKAVLGTSSVAGFNTAFATVRAALPPAAAASLALISAHEKAHVSFLQTTISQLLQGTPGTYDPATTFDFTGSRTVGGSATGPFYPATQSVAFLLAATQGFEDTGVRAYKGQAGKLLGQRIPLTAALQIHSIEARHAARIRRMRRLFVPAEANNAQISYLGIVKGDGATAAGGANLGALPQAVADAFAAIYQGEGNTKHTVNNGSDVTIDVTTLSNTQPGTDFTAPFDEALGATAVAGIVQPFIIPTLPPLSPNLQLTNVGF